MTLKDLYKFISMFVNEFSDMNVVVNCGGEEYNIKSIEFPNGKTFIINTESKDIPNELLEECVWSNTIKERLLH